jgi:hypothetical protein
MNTIKPNDLTEKVMELLETYKHIRFEEGFFVIDYGGYDYDIEQSQVDTVGKLLTWVLHLSEKSWMDSCRVRYFANLVAKHNNLKFPGVQEV